MDTLTVGEAATAIQVSPSTIRNYTDIPELQPFFSHVATRKGAYSGAKERLYTKDDVIVLNTIKIHKKHSNTWADVAQILEQGIREEDLPESSLLVMPETKAESFQMLSIARQQIEVYQERMEKLEGELETQRKLHRNDIERLMQQQADLHETIGALKFILKMHGIDSKTGTKQGD